MAEPFMFDENLTTGRPTPFYRSYQAQDLYAQNIGEEKDIDMIKSFYPLKARQLQAYVEEECDKMEYDGSIMFDEYPDKEMLRLVSKRICHRLESEGALEEQEQEEMIAMNRWGSWDGRRGNWLRDFVDVLLFNEVFRRRCRRRDCGRWWY